MSLHISSLSKSFGHQAALDDLHLSLDSGIVALLGANGSGKSTLLRVLATLTRADNGSVQWNDLDYVRDIKRLRQCIAYLPQELDLPEEITPRRLLNYLAQMRLVHDKTQIDRLLKALNISDEENRPLMKLSNGQIRLVGIAQALLGAPELLLLDEPFAGLSFDERRRVSNLLEHSDVNCLVIFSTHIPAEAERLAQQIVVLHRGCVLFHGTSQEMADRAHGCVYEVEVRQSSIVESLQQYRASRVINHVDSATLRIISPNITVANAHLVAPSLEDAYLLLTSDIPHS